MKGFMGMLSAGAIASFVLPVALRGLPIEFKFLSFLVSTGFGATLINYAKDYEAYEKEDREEDLIYDIANEIRIEKISGHLGSIQTQYQVQQEIMSVEAVRQRLHALYPRDEAQRLCMQYGIFDPTWVPPNERNQVTTTAREVVEPSYTPQESAIEVYEDQPSTIQTYSGSYQTLKQSNQPQQVNLILPEEDIARLYAKNTTDPGLISNLLITAEPGCGKSSLICALMHYCLEANNGSVDFTVVAGKKPDPSEDPGYCGFEDEVGQDYIEGYDYRSTPSVRERQETLNEFCLQDARPFPTITINDEWNNTLKCASAYDKIFKPKVKELDLIKELKAIRLTQGRSRRVVDIDTSHSALVEDLGLNRQLQHAYQKVILGRANKTSAISRSFTKTIIGSEAEAEILKQQWEEYFAKAHPYNQGVVALTNIGTGKWRLIRLPDYRAYSAKIKNKGVLNSNILEAEIEEDAWDEEKEVTKKLQPTVNPHEPQKNSEPGEQLALYDRFLADIPAEIYQMDRSQAVKGLKQMIKEFWLENGEETTDDIEIRLAQYIYDIKRRTA